MIESRACAIGAALVVSLLTQGSALAAGPGGAAPRAWVSALGSDAAGCGSISTPCRSFQYAHDSIVQPGGTIYVKDAGNFVSPAPFLITHAISIINDGAGLATIFAATSDAIVIQAGATDKILIKGLTIDGVGTGSNGIKLTSAGSLTVANATIKGFAGCSGPGNGIYARPSSGTLKVDISDTFITGNGCVGAFFDPTSSANVEASLTRVQANGNQYGVYAQGSGSGTMTVVVDQVTANNNKMLGFAVSNASLYLARSTASGNSTGVYNLGTAYSSGDNAIYGNATNVSAPLTAAPLQ